MVLEKTDFILFWINKFSTYYNVGICSKGRLITSTVKPIN